MHLFDCYISRQQHGWMAAAAAATGESCGSACAADKQQKKSNAHLLLEQPASQPRVVLDQLLGAQAVLDRVGYVTHPKNGVEQTQRTNMLKRAWTLTGLCCVMRAAEDDCRPGSGSRMLPWRHPAKGGERNRKGGVEGLCNVNEMVFFWPKSLITVGEF